MTNTKLGTRWVGIGEGETINEIFFLLSPLETWPRLCKRAWDHLTVLSKKDQHWDYFQTNLALTGEPLTDEDLRRIAECE